MAILVLIYWRIFCCFESYFFRSSYFSVIIMSALKFQRKKKSRRDASLFLALSYSNALLVILLDFAYLINFCNYI